ncbi:MAG TPA: NADH-quinone oxidoreductase subunit L [Acidimicrobiales bacterium]|nr:NADH-quinone oxidoreductase subunit L [Acidimicrobiales bacterium]
MTRAVFLIPLLPLFGFLVLAAAGRKIGNPLAGWLATAMVGGSFVVTIIVFSGLFQLAPAHRSVSQNWFSWLPVDHLQVHVGLLVDPLSMTMAAFVTGVSTLIHLYSIGYMEHDEQFPKFFLYLNLFVSSMLFLVLANNFLLTFLGWEGVGVCSYFLIAFWFDRDSAASAGKKAMIFNRIGDVGFLVAMFLIFEATGSLDYGTVFSHLTHVPTSTLTAIALLLFLGAAGKSAQIPLYPWLADAMEGPTPVSALIHAATMVTAGVFLMCRINPILHGAPDAANTVAWVGVVTALLAGTIACAQNDIKKVLAYSTISQLGYMFLAAGVGAYVAAMFLMLAHAFYKALLFLGAGSVIHAMDDEQDIKRMGALRALMPITGVTFLLAWFAIGGVPPLAGFWAKGDILVNAYSKSPALYVVGAITAVLTAYYMGREYFLVFQGEARWSEGGKHGHGDAGAATSGHGTHGDEHGGLHPHDPPWTMRLPLLVLVVASVLGGLVDLPIHPTWDFLERWLAPVFGSNLADYHLSATHQILFAVVDGVLAVAGCAIAYALWSTVSDRPQLEPSILQRAWMIDWSYDRVLARGSTALSAFSSAVIDNKVIDGAVNGVAALVRGTAGRLRRAQTGYVRNYALGIVAGLVVVMAFLITRAGA